MPSFLSFVFLLATLLASRVYALEILVGGSVGNVSATDFLTITDSSVANTVRTDSRLHTFDDDSSTALDQCTSECAPAKSAIAACTDDTCLCNTTTIQDVATCEQCMFNALIAGDLQMTDPREGSQVALTAYGAACGTALDTTIAASLTTLTLPPDWDGPFGQGLSPVATGFVVAIAATMAGTSIWILCSM
ncbi:uncharacterized protein B0H18DRAFT_1021906 [Fomitopsis serialis]|uniref:uncharacterized protein n=1 Tax=Fomitopsis serialis TaxID=139415 RepID=UPI0020084CCB|nr:uncharacterized protein B0H18DRAFT_1021906 [Neoantrodia serialis]KAH9921104.1 hypothetical protein B0H18DRAFT_1021906 [Neoantrodia serialis]